MSDHKGDEGPMVFKSPEYSEWQVYLFGAHNMIILRPLKNHEPNWFWRKMQYLCFGNEWKKEPEPPPNLFPWRNAS